MAYKALYRAYRPQRFEDMAGQEHITTTLKNAIKEKKIAHAYLFAGPRGTGKTTVAKLLAKAVNCTDEDVSNKPCNECESCISITRGDHPDVVEIDAASNNGVDEIRDLIDKVKYAPINGKYKVYIIDEVHMMSAAAFNALLKTLEEPPEHIIFILATTEPHKILPTIISRCQRFDFKRVEENDIVSRLEFVLKEENRKYELEALEIVARLADGGMRDALSILEQCLAFNDELTVDNVNEVYGLLSMDNKINFVKQLLSKDLVSVLNNLDNMLQGSVDIKRLTFDLIDVLKDIIIYKNTNDEEALFVLNKNNINTIVPYITVDEAFKMIDIFVEASDHYGSSLNGKTYFELAVLKICNKIEDREVKAVEEVKPIEIKKEVVQEEIVQPQETKTTVEDQVEEIIEEAPKIEETITHEEQVNEPVEDYQEDEVFPEEEPIPTMQIEENELVGTPSNIEIDFNDILNILVQAKRAVLNDIQDKWPVISKYRFNINTIKYANMLCDAKPVAATDNAFIITLEHQPQVNEVNYSKNYVALKDFLKEVLGDDYDFIAVKETEWPKIRNKYIELNKNNELPEPKAIVLHHIVEVKEEKEQISEAKQEALEMFGDIVKFE